MIPQSSLCADLPMKPSPYLLAVALLPTVFAACGGSDSDATPVKLARYVTNIQCEPLVTTLQDVDQQLARAGITVLNRSCAWDGTGTIAACGASTSYLRAVEVPKFQESEVRDLGYLAPEEFYMFLESDCPAR